MYDLTWLGGSRLWRTKNLRNIGKQQWCRGWRIMNDRRYWSWWESKRPWLENLYKMAWSTRKKLGDKKTKHTNQSQRKPKSYSKCEVVEFKIYCNVEWLQCAKFVTFASYTFIKNLWLRTRTLANYANSIKSRIHSPLDRIVWSLLRLWVRLPGGKIVQNLKLFGRASRTM